MPTELAGVLTEELPDDENEENEEDPEIVSYIDEVYDSKKLIPNSKRYPQVLSFQFQ